MAKRSTTIELEEQQIEDLERLATRRSESVEQLIRQAVDRYLIAQSDDWGARFDALVARVQARTPAGVSPDEIEADITAAAVEAREARADRRTGRGGGADPTRR